MALLKHIKDTCCPTCGARTVSEKITAKHCNGQQFETRGFACGHAVKWVPNYGRQEVESPCSKDPILLSRDEARACAMDKTRTFINDLPKVDVDWKDAVLTALRGIYFR